MKNADSQKSKFSPSNSTGLVDERYLNETYKSEIKAFTNIASDLPINACYSCEKLCCMKDLHKIEKVENILRNSSVWNEILKFDDTRSIEKNYICDYCYQKIREHNVPATSIINNLFNVKLPDELATINYNESMLISNCSTIRNCIR